MFFYMQDIFRSLSSTLASGLVLAHREENTDPWQIFDPWKNLAISSQLYTSTHRCDE